MKNLAINIQKAWSHSKKTLYLHFANHRENLNYFINHNQSKS